MLSRLVGSFKNRSNTSGSRSSRAGVRRLGNNPNLDDIKDDGDLDSLSSEEGSYPERQEYSRPKFLHLTKAEEGESGNHNVRPIVTPKDGSRVPLHAGYAECINGGKSRKNEDLGAVGNFLLSNQPNGAADGAGKVDIIDVHYFAIFDGHAGPGAALMAADQLINHLQEKLVQIQEDLFTLRTRDSLISSKDGSSSAYITIDSLVRGALEAAFVAFDEHIARERHTFSITGGCAAVVAVVILDRVYVAHAGDCRAVAYFGSEIQELASEFTPETDSKRIQQLAHLQPELTHSLFSENYFIKSLTKKDIGTRVLYRAPQRSGWCYKEVTEEDVRQPPLVVGQGKWARLMGIIGVTRGFGDHGLVIPATKIHIKPFLTAIPEVRVLNLADKVLMEDDVLVMGSDGLWDMLRNEQVGSTVRSSLAMSRENETDDRYSKAAEDLVHLARGDNTGKGWKMKDGCEGSFDDITAFVIPLQNCRNTSSRKSHKI